MSPSQVHRLSISLSFSDMLAVRGLARSLLRQQVVLPVSRYDCPLPKYKNCKSQARIALHSQVTEFTCLAPANSLSQSKVEAPLPITVTGSLCHPKLKFTKFQMKDRTTLLFSMTVSVRVNGLVQPPPSTYGTKETTA